MLPTRKRCIRCDRPFRVFNQRLAGWLELCSGCRFRSLPPTPPL